MKSTLVGSTWFLAYYALKHLPITIVTPIRATGPIWTLIGALIIYKEQYSTLQWIGMGIVLGFFYFFSLAGKREGINFTRNKWIYFIMLATFLGSISTLYDKYLIAHYDRMAVQVWFSIYLIPVFLPFMIFMWYPERQKTRPFEWRWSIPLIGILLTCGDFAYYYALSEPDMLIAILSVLRRTSVIVSFTIGAIIFKEINLKRKAFALFGIFVGVFIIVLGS
jgi:transporter family protein